MEVVLDIGDVAEEFALGKEEVSQMIDYVVKQITAVFANNWQIMAQKNLKSSRVEYIRSLYVGDTGKYTGFVMLRGMLPNMVESGASAFDEKTGFLRSSKAKPKKDGSGMYFTVPFRWATPGSIGDSAIFSGILPTQIYNIARKKSPSISGLGGTMKSGSGIKAKELPSEFQIPKTRQQIITKSAVFNAYKHKSSVYAGISRDQKTYENATQGSYVSFRRVSDKSDPDSWIHRGIVARELAEKAMQVTKIRHEVDVNTDNFLSQLGF